MTTDDFHPAVGGVAALRHLPAAGLDADTAQTPGMRRLAAVSTSTVGAAHLWMGQTTVDPGSRSGNHHHGDSETAIYVVSGRPEFVFLDPDTRQEVRLRPAPGDYVFVPPHTPHREENNDPEVAAVVVLARSTQEAIVVNLDSLEAPLQPPAG